ncbi:MAG: HAMP domain-containing sensor histidine kinase [Peptoniphilus duerdenii]|uniref:sensor histidine kinase n=1 Tax=Peptoniphilus duerdenii TaxID=507750 RepID=UPI002550EF7D|nr:HAMP domain-containing sensor histidine kinase [Peptoniphilus duerdenii]MDK8275728.1 HAMP domain-containing sensor histidine kinase [Peptoniphilus duerdenii]
MKNIKIFPKMFIQIFSVLGIITILTHLLVFFIFPKTYLETRKEEIYTRANEISASMEGRKIENIEEALKLYSDSSEIKAYIKSKENENEIPVGDINIDLEGSNNSLILEEREISLDTGEKVELQFISSKDMQKEAKNLSFKFLPYSLSASILFSAIVSLIYARMIKNNIQEIKNVTDKMMELNRQVRLKVDSKDEMGQLKEQINTLYSTLLKSIDDVEIKNSEILKLEKLKYDFLKGSSHELKTPLASLKIILENMKYKIGKYKDRDHYIDECIEIADELSQNISQILTVSSLENLKDDEEEVKVSEILDGVLNKYELMANQKHISIKNNISEEKIYIGRTALRIILSNLISNAVKYSDEYGNINIGSEKGHLYIENTYENKSSIDIDKIFDVNFDLSKKNSNGLGLYIVSSLLKNYKIKYRATQGDSSFKFEIELNR